MSIPLSFCFDLGKSYFLRFFIFYLKKLGTKRMSHLILFIQQNSIYLCRNQGLKPAITSGRFTNEGALRVFQNMRAPISKINF